VHVDPPGREERLLEAVLLEPVGRARLGEALGVQAVAHEIHLAALHHEELDALVDAPSELDLVEVWEALPGRAGSVRTSTPPASTSIPRMLAPDVA
jgi:hypothetical protein